jgi:RND family efflux transporter MFP subunit
MQNMKKFFLPISIALILIVAGVALRHQRQTELDNIQAPNIAPWAVNVVKVKQGNATVGFPAVAEIKGMNDVAITPRLSGIILTTAVREGSYVDKGSLLAQIDTQELHDQLNSLLANKASAQTDAKNKQRDAQRAKKLLLNKGISQSSADQLIAAAKSAQERVTSLTNQLAAAKTHINYAKITAPFSGVVADRMVDPGDFAAQGKPMFRLISDQGARIVIRLPASVLEKVSKNTIVELSNENKVKTLKVDRIYPSVDARSLGHIEIDLNEIPFNLSIGSLLHARVVNKTKLNSLIIPADALLPTHQVLVIKNKKIQTVTVNVLFQAKEGIAVEGNLQTNDQIIVAHESQLLKMNNGDTVMLAGDL